MRFGNNDADYIAVADTCNRVVTNYLRTVRREKLAWGDSKNLKVDNDMKQELLHALALFLYKLHYYRYVDTF